MCRSFLDVMPGAAGCFLPPVPQVASCLFTLPYRRLPPSLRPSQALARYMNPATGGIFAAGIQPLSWSCMGWRARPMLVGSESSPRSRVEAASPLLNGGRGDQSPGYDRTARPAQRGAHT